LYNTEMGINCAEVEEILGTAGEEISRSAMADF
jgi:hypothetical protein